LLVDKSKAVVSDEATAFLLGMLKRIKKNNTNAIAYFCIVELG
jgi:hypothetical protein